MSTRQSRTLILSLSLVAGCTLTTPASDFFDDRGIETIAVVDDVRALALVDSSLYVSDGVRLMRIAAQGEVDEPIEVARTTGGGLHDVVTNGTTLLAWCDGSEGGAWYIASGGAPQRVPGSAACTSLAVGPDSILQLVRTSVGGAVRRFEVSQQAFAPDVRLPGTADSAALATTEDGSIVAATTAGVVRQCLPDDRGCENDLCRLSSVARPLEVRGFRVTEAGAAGRPLLVTAFQAILFAPTPHCCSFDEDHCASDAVRSRRGVSNAEAVEVFDGSLYALRQGRVSRIWSFVDPAMDEEVAPAAPNARLLALGRTHAYFVEGRKVQRTALRVQR